MLDQSSPIHFKNEVQSDFQIRYFGNVAVILTLASRELVVQVLAIRTKYNPNWIFETGLETGAGNANFAFSTELKPKLKPKSVSLLVFNLEPKPDQWLTNLTTNQIEPNWRFLKCRCYFFIIIPTRYPVGIMVLKKK
jgi:hypothetical protein